MSARFVNLDRQTPMLLPCDRREWLPADHRVPFILDAVEPIPTGHFRINQRGTGSAQYPPPMMLALLIYCYATGRFGSRTIEAATHSDVAVRYLCANHHPDPDSIDVFRSANRAAFEAAFVTGLQLAQRDAGKKPRGREPQPPSEPPDPKAQHHFTEPESRIMQAGNGRHFEQACNAQAAVNEVRLIVGQRVSDAPNDQQELVASGFYSAAAVPAVEQKSDGTPSGLTVYAAVGKQSHHKTVAD